MTMRKFGRFSLPTLFFKNLHEGEGTNWFQGMVVLRAEENFPRDTVDYVAIHKDFDYCPVGQIIPEYEGIIEAGETYPKWKRLS